MKPRFILPPHPKSDMRIRRKDLHDYEAMGRYVAQRKFNGTNTVIWIYRDEVVLWERRGKPMTLYKLTEGMSKCLLGLNRDPDKEVVLNGELLHTKAKSDISNRQEATDTIVLFDVLMHDSQYLTNIDQMARLDILSDLCGGPTSPESLEQPKFPGATRRALVVAEEDTAHLWLAETFLDEFQYHFDECCFDQVDAKGRDRYEEIEGLVLRLKDNRLRIGSHGGVGDVDWLIRCRKPKDNQHRLYAD